MIVYVYVCVCILHKQYLCICICISFAGASFSICVRVTLVTNSFIRANQTELNQNTQTCKYTNIASVCVCVCGCVYEGKALFYEGER